jgi:hypothetical protein
MRIETLADDNVRIHLDQPIPLHGEPKRVVTLRPPNFGEIMRLGDPSGYVVDGSGALMPVVDRSAMQAYASLLIVDHSYEILALGRHVALALAVERAILGFFYRRASDVDRTARALVERGIGPGDIERMSLDHMFRWSQLMRG